DPHPTVTVSPSSGSTFALGTTTVTVTATDASGNAATATFKVTVIAPVPPVLAAIKAQVVNPGQAVKFTAQATNPNQPPSPLRFSLDTGAPAGAAIDPTSGAFTWAGSTTPGDYAVTVRVTDVGLGLSAAQTVTIHVNRPPTLPVPADQKVQGG